MSAVAEVPAAQATAGTSPHRLRKVLYHHRTQGKAVEGVHIRGITDALRAEGVAVDILSLPGADPYSTPKALSPTRQARPWMRLFARLPEPLFEIAELAYNLVAGWRVLAWLRRNPDADLVYERYSLFMFAPVWLVRRHGGRTLHLVDGELAPGGGDAP